MPHVDEARSIDDASYFGVHDRPYHHPPGMLKVIDERKPLEFLTLKD